MRVVPERDGHHRRLLPANADAVHLLREVDVVRVEREMPRGQRHR